MADVVLEAGAQLGEGPVWHEARGRLMWVDIDGRSVHLFDPDSGRDIAIDVGQPVGAAVPAVDGHAVLAVQRGFARLDIDGGEVTEIAEVEADDPRKRMNDGKCDPAGRLLAGTMAFDFTPGAGALYRLDLNGRVERVVDGVTISNGLGWSPDGRTMYYIDSPTQQVDAFTYEAASGAIADRRTVLEIPTATGLPDGMTVDAEGFLWVALWGGGAVQRSSPAGVLDVTIEVPAEHTTSCAFGGPDYATLFITSAAGTGPHSGAVFACRPGPVGVAAFLYGAAP